MRRHLIVSKETGVKSTFLLKHRRSSSPVALTALFVLAAACLLSAQSTNSSLSGEVKDPSGAVVAKAELTLTADATGTVRRLTTNADGVYRFAGLQAGSYSLQVSAQGFAMFRQEGVILALNETATLNVALRVGAGTETVQVNDTASPINRDDGSHKGEISPEVLNDLPLNVSGSSRSAVSFVVVLPGVNTGAGNNPFETRINGGMKMGDEAALDGASMQEGLMSQSGVVSMHSDYPISPEAISEVSVITSTYDPQYGTTTSGVITAVTKSGTNEFHGDLREYLHNTALNATQYGSPYKPKDIENQFGGSLGGPVKLPGIWSTHNKAFFFVNIERWTIRGGTVFPVVSIPSEQERKGDFTDWTDASGNLIPIYDPATTHANPSYNPSAPVGPGNLPYLRSQFMGCDGMHPNVICSNDPRLQTSMAQQWLQYMPPPTFSGALNNFVSPVPVSDISGAGTDHRQNYDIRIDDYIGQKDHVAANLHYHNTVFAQVSNLPPPISNDTYLLPDGGEIGPWVIRWNWDHTFSPNLVNNLNYGYLDFRGSEISIDAPYVDKIPKIPGVANYKAPPQLNFADGFLSMGSDLLHHESRPTNVINDLVSWTRGRHTFRFGGELRTLQNNLRDNNNQSGSFNFSDLNTGLLGINSGSAVASFLLGYVDNANVSFNNVDRLYGRGQLYALHAGDTWKATEKLSITYGLRWDLNTPSVEKYDRFSFLDPTAPNPGAGGLPGTLAFAGTKWGTGASYGGRHPELTYYHAFAPRLGMAFSLTPKTVVRGGYGIFFSQAFYPGWSAGIAQDGFNTNPTLSSTQGGLSAAMMLNQGFPSNIPKNPDISPSFDNGQNGPLYRPLNANRLPYSQQWNFTVEHQFTNNLYVSAAYVANKGTRLLSDVQPINVLNPTLLSMGQKLYDEFAPGQTELDGVPAPYTGWAAQMQSCAPSVAQALLPYPQYCGKVTGVNENVGNSTYHSFQLKVEQRFSKGLWLLGTYTLAKLLTDADTVQSMSLENGNLGATGVISPYQSYRNKSISLDDVPQTFNFSTLYDLPVGLGKKFLNTGGVVNAVLGGWSVSTLIKISSGTPFFFRSSTCNVPAQFGVGCIPTQVAGVNPFLQDPTHYDPAKGPLFNVAAFQDPNSFNFTFGDGPRISNLRGPRFSNQDFSLIKNVKLTERFDLRFQAEFFNIWNQHIFVCETRCFGTTAFDNDIASPTFGQWNGNVSTPRNIQFALKLLF
jgi:hypothetical protein